jgi:integrase
MASLSTDKKNGHRLIQFLHPATSDRRTLRLGKMTMREAESFKTKLERVLFCKTAGTTPEAEIAAWVNSLDKRMATKLTELGLIAARTVDTGKPLGRFLDDYFAKRIDVKASTQVAYGRVRRHLVKFFGEDRLLGSVTPGDADDFQLYLQGQGLAENTIRRHIGYARQFFKVALRHKLITENPFIDLKAGSVASPDRFYYLIATDAEKLIQACPDTEWRLIVALARYGGFRTPSETFAIQWQHVNWETSRITVQSPKTERYAGHATRVIPIFPELRPYLEAAWDQAEPGAVYLITSFRETKKNLRTRFERIIQRAGLTPWPRLFQNLRSSRETELAETYPIQVVVAWMGNSVPVAKKHYLQVTDDHFAKALGSNAAQALQPASEPAGQR